MRGWTHKYKPAASVQSHLLLAATTWTLVGAALLVIGLAWDRPVRWPWGVILPAAAAGLGLLKFRLVLRKTASRIVHRIRSRGDERCLGGFISWRMWLGVGVMMALGRLLRGGVLPQPVPAFVYQTVGVALLAGAIILWQSYHRSIRAV